MTRALALLTLAALAACASSAPIRWAPATDYTLDIADNPDQQRFDVKLTSKATAPLCLSKEAWPALETLPAGFDGAMLSTSAGTQALLPTGSAYCPGGCGDMRVEAGQTLVGAIHYAAFGDATTIGADTTRALVFEVHPFVCAR